MDQVTALAVAALPSALKSAGRGAGPYVKEIAGENLSGAAGTM